MYAGLPKGNVITCSVYIQVLPVEKMIGTCRNILVYTLHHGIHAIEV